MQIQSPAMIATFLISLSLFVLGDGSTPDTNPDAKITGIAAGQADAIEALAAELRAAEDRADELAAELAALEASSVEGLLVDLTPPDVAPPQPRETVCQCQGYRRDQCLCLAAGVTCGCTLSSGSLWREDPASGSLVKTHERRTVDPGSTPADIPKRSSGSAVHYSGGRWQWTDSTGLAWSSATEPTEGQAYSYGGTRFEYRAGEMIETRRATVTPPTRQPAVRYSQSCPNGQCYRYSR